MLATRVTCYTRFRLADARAQLQAIAYNDANESRIVEICGVPFATFQAGAEVLAVVLGEGVRPGPKRRFEVATKAQPAVDQDAPARHPTAQAILEAAIEDLQESGEGSIRITRVLERSGAAYGSLYHHFGSRENLVKEAVVERYLRAVQQGLVAFGAAVAKVETKAQLLALLDAELKRYGSPAVMEQRRQRYIALGSAAARADILAEIGAQQSRYFDAAGEAIDVLRQRGLIDPDLDPRDFSAWYLSLVLSRLLIEIDPKPGTTEGWTRMTRAAVLGLLDPRDPG